MTRPDVQPDPPVEGSGVDSPPATNPPIASPATRWRWPSRRQSLALAGAFLIGACMCGGAGLAIGAVVANHRFDWQSNMDRGDGGYGPNNTEHGRQGDNDEPKSNKTTPRAPARSTPSVTTPAPSVSPS
jgi:hypothetical protein